MFVLELIGAAAFAVSGAMAAIKRHADIFGVLFLGVITALGGGVIRDVLLGQLPPKMFVSYWYLLAAVLAVLLFIGRRHTDYTYIEQNGFAMGTVVSQKLYGGTAEDAAAEARDLAASQEGKVDE